MGKDIDIVFRVFNTWKTSNITFHFKLGLKNEELASLLKWKVFWTKHFKKNTFMYQKCILFMQKLNLSGILSKNP